MVPRHADDRENHDENHDENQKASAGFGSRARLKFSAASTSTEAPPEKVRGFFIAFSMIPDHAQMDGDDT